MLEGRGASVFVGSWSTCTSSRRLYTFSLIQTGSRIPCVWYRSAYPGRFQQSPREGQRRSALRERENYRERERDFSQNSVKFIKISYLFLGYRSSYKKFGYSSFVGTAYNLYNFWNLPIFFVKGGSFSEIMKYFCTNQRMLYSVSKIIQSITAPLILVIKKK